MKGCFVMSVTISPSVLACDFTKLGEEVADIERCGADMVHLDVMDGTFVTNLSFGLPVIEALRKKSGMVFDVHLMIDEPHRYAKRFIEAGADILTFHIEAEKNIGELLELIRANGAKSSLSIKPATPASAVFPYLEKCDMILVMTVEPGFGGQSFIPETLDSVRALKQMIDASGRDIDIEVDGGITKDTIPEAYKAGANVFVAGSAVFRAADPAVAINELKSACEI